MGSLWLTVPVSGGQECLGVSLMDITGVWGSRRSKTMVLWGPGGFILCTSAVFDGRLGEQGVYLVVASVQNVFLFGRMCVSSIQEVVGWVFHVNSQCIGWSDGCLR